MEAYSGTKDKKIEERPKLVVLINGPYLLINDNEPTIIIGYLQNSKGEPLSTIRGVSLCRCGASNNKPFYDGMHRTISFKDDKN